MLYFYRNQWDFHPSAAPASYFFFSLSLFKIFLFFFIVPTKISGATFIPQLPQAAISHTLQHKLISLRTFVTIIIFKHKLQWCCRPSLNFHSFAYCLFLIKMARFISHKTTGVTCRREAEKRKAPGGGTRGRTLAHPVLPPGGFHRGSISLWWE